MKPKYFVYLLMGVCLMLSACNMDEDQSKDGSQNGEVAEGSKEDTSDDQAAEESDAESEEDESVDSADLTDDNMPNVPDGPNVPEFPEYTPPNVPEFPEYTPPNVPDFPEVELPNVSIETDENEVTLQVPDTLLFGFDKSSLKSEAKQTLDQVGKALEEYDGANVQINGHTDNVGDDQYNMNLSEERAKSVKEYLDDQGALEQVTVQTKGYGKTKPIASNDNEKGQQKNRRVEIVIETSEE